MPDKLIVAVDFDGVLCQIGPAEAPVPGAVRWLNRVGNSFDVVVFTRRAADPVEEDHVRDWLRAHGFRRVPVTAVKPQAHVFVDDRALTFQGPDLWPTDMALERFQPWWRK